MNKALQNPELPILIQQFVETIENNSKEILSEEGTDNFLKEYNITDGVEFLNAVIKHYADPTPNNKYTLMSIEFLQGEYELILENNPEFLIDHYVSYLVDIAKEHPQLIEAIFRRKLLKNKHLMRDVMMFSAINEMLEIKNCPDDLKNIYTLTPAGFGRYADPENGEIVAKMQDGKLVAFN